jgi:hypothetical protein
MDKQEARLVLQACRPNGEDAALPVFAEALALVERDPELAAWWQAQQAFDRKFAAKLQEIPLPPDLRATILAGRKIEQMTARSYLPQWLAIAAMFLVVGLIGGLFFPSRTHEAGPLAAAGYDESALAFLGNDAPSLGMMSSDHEQVLAWLKQQNAPVGSIPAKMETLPSVGCQTFAVHGHSVSLICFTMAGGRLAHLFVIERPALSDPPGRSPEFGQNGAWSTASWSDDAHSYLLATQDKPEALKQLL